MDLSLAPAGAASWTIGPDSAIGPNGLRLAEGDIWCGVALYTDRSAADAALDAPYKHLPFVANTVEAWHALLMPITHRGERNHLDRSNPGEVFDAAHADPGGPLLVRTTAGFNLTPDMDLERLKDFLCNVDRVRTWMGDTDGLLATQTFAPYTRVDDGVTMSLWRDEASMATFAYRLGLHRTQSTVTGPSTPQTAPPLLAAAS